MVSTPCEINFGITSLDGVLITLYEYLANKHHLKKQLLHLYIYKFEKETVGNLIIVIIWRPPSISELTLIFDMGLSHLCSEAFI